MLIRLTAALVFATALFASPVFAAPQPVDPAKMMGRWYEIARAPNAIQRGCEAGASDWTRAGDGFSVVQTCHKGAPDGPLATWKAKARATDPTNTKFRMSFFGGLVSQEYQVLDRKDSDGWLILATHDGRYMWLMSQRPTLPAPVRAQAMNRIKELGFDPSRLEWPAPAQG
jgi:apolipoprotein D and lipocalin family protein